MLAIHERNPDFIHHQANTPRSSIIREVIFGLEDGMVSTMGAITGIAAGSHNHFTVVLAGLVIISVESISMAVGSYLSSKSEQEIDARKLREERIELNEFPVEEEAELVEMYVNDGWPVGLATEMAKAAASDKELFLREMAYRELHIIPSSDERPLHNGVAMGCSYIIGGAVAIIPYLFIKNLGAAVPVSVIMTLIGLFLIGAFTTKYSKRVWWKAGLEMFGLAAAAAIVGYIVGQAASQWL